MKLAILTVLCVSHLNGQEFEVASIKLSAAPTSQRIRVAFDGGPGTTDPTRFSCRNCSLSLLLMRAYDVEYHQVAGLDAHSEFYDITAKIREGASREQFRVMLQNLLADRFRMSLHREVKQMQAYELVVGKNGPKVGESGPETVTREAPVSVPSRVVLDSEGFPLLPTGQSGYASVNGRARMRVLNETMDQLAGRISNQLDMPVINATGLAGRYAFDLRWTGRSVETTDGVSLDLFSAVESQLGLRLQSKKAPVTVIVIDHAERTPAEN